MNLGFSTLFPYDKKDIGGQPTNFIKKIWKGIIDNDLGLEEIKDYWYYSDNHLDNISWDKEIIFDTPCSLCNGKIHTIRSDKKNRWNKGKIIHFKYWEGRPFHSNNVTFAPIIHCTGKERIIIVHPDKGTTKFHPYVIIGEEHIFFGDKRLHELAVNDGFDNVYEFFKYFDEYYEGFIIHWTNKRYDQKNIEVTGPETVKCNCKCKNKNRCQK